MSKGEYALCPRCGNMKKGDAIYRCKGIKCPNCTELCCVRCGKEVVFVYCPVCKSEAKKIGKIV